MTMVRPLATPLARVGSRLDDRVENLALGVGGGALLALPFLHPALWWLHYGALVPWVVLCTRERSRAVWLSTFAGAFTFFAVSLSPFALFHAAVPFVLALFYAPFVLPFALLLRGSSLRSGAPLTLLVPVTWVAAEWLRLTLSIGQAAMYPLGTAQYGQRLLIQIADLTGVAGVSFLVACANGAAVDLLAGGIRRRRHTWAPALFPLLLGAALLYAVLRDHRPVDPGGPRLALIQPNVTHYRDPERAQAVFAEQLRFTRAEIAPGSADLIVWPENAVSVPLSDDAGYLEELGALAREQQAAVVFGAFTPASLRPPRLYTSAYYLSEQGELVGRYHKLHLIPWSEYMPFDALLARLSPALRRAHHALTRTLLGFSGAGMPGREVVVFALEDGGSVHRFAVPICFEVSSSGFARDATARGADLLLNITSEGVFGPAIYTHMLAHSAFRAVENRVAVVRAANNGISGVVDATGRVRSVVRGNRTGRPYLEAGTLVARVPLGSRRSGTFYSRHGDVFTYLCVAVSLIGSALAMRPKLRSKESTAAGTQSRP